MVTWANTFISNEVAHDPEWHELHPPAAYALKHDSSALDVEAALHRAKELCRELFIRTYHFETAKDPLSALLSDVFEPVNRFLSEFCPGATQSFMDEMSLREAINLTVSEWIDNAADNCSQGDEKIESIAFNLRSSALNRFLAIVVNLAEIQYQKDLEGVGHCLEKAARESGFTLEKYKNFDRCCPISHAEILRDMVSVHLIETAAALGNAESFFEFLADVPEFEPGRVRELLAHFVDQSLITRQSLAAVGGDTAQLDSVIEQAQRILAFIDSDQL